MNEKPCASTHALCGLSPVPNMCLAQSMALPVFDFLPHTGHITGSLTVYPSLSFPFFFFRFLFLQGIDDHFRPDRAFLHLDAEAWNIALPIAAAVGLVRPSPASFAPYGPSGSYVSISMPWARSAFPWPGSSCSRPGSGSSVCRPHTACIHSSRTRRPWRRRLRAGR